MFTVDVNFGKHLLVTHSKQINQLNLDILILYRTTDIHIYFCTVRLFFYVLFD